MVLSDSAVCIFWADGHAGEAAAKALFIVIIQILCIDDVCRKHGKELCRGACVQGMHNRMEHGIVNT